MASTSNSSNDSSSTNSEFRRVTEELIEDDFFNVNATKTSQFQENFEVYIQALISQCLDANFLDEVFNDAGKLITYCFFIAEVIWLEFRWHL